MNYNTRLVCLFLISILFFAYSVITMAQEVEHQKSVEEKITDAENKLALKLLLDKEQLIQIDSILTASISESLSSESREKILEEVNQKIEIILTKRQKAKFNLLKSSWLDEIIGYGD